MKTSVALCTYNGELFLRQQIESIINQTEKVDEIVVCDDGSTDDTISILNSYNEKFPGVFRIYQNAENLRSVRNFEKAISLCTHEVIFLSDQDDIWQPEKVEKMKGFFTTNPNINVVATNGYGINEEGALLDLYSLWDVPAFLKEKKIEVNYFHLIAFSGNIATGASMALRKKFVEQIMPFPVVEGIYHDEWIALNAAAFDKFMMLKEKLFKYRIHKNQQVGNVFVPKTKKGKEMLINIFDHSLQDNSFKSYKRMLKRISNSYGKNAVLGKHEQYGVISEMVRKELEGLHHYHKKLFFKTYPVAARLLAVSDFFLNKRKLKANRPQK